MKDDIISLNDTLKLLIKNSKGIFASIAAGIIFGLIVVFINNFFEKKISISAKILIKNPLENYLILDLLSLDKLQMYEEKVKTSSTEDKIKNYYTITKEYMRLISGLTNISKYDIDPNKYNYKVKTNLKESEFIINFQNVSNSKKVKENLIKLTADYNKIIKRIILENISLETEFIENFLEISSSIQNTQELLSLIKIRKSTVRGFEDKKLEIFDLKVDETLQTINNRSIVLTTTLLTFSLFLLFVILKK